MSSLMTMGAAFIMLSRKPGRTSRTIAVIAMLFIGAIVLAILLLWQNAGEDFFKHKLTPLVIALSACIGVLSAVLVTMSNRRETVRQNTLDILNRLDCDNEYWGEAKKLLHAINRYRREQVKEGKCHHHNGADCDCPIPTLREVDHQYQKYEEEKRAKALHCGEATLNVSRIQVGMTLNPEREAAEKTCAVPMEYRVKTALVLRKMEWLCERAELGLIDYGMLAQRKGVMINFVYDACHLIIKKKVQSHQSKNGQYGIDTTQLVYLYLRTPSVRKKLFRMAKQRSRAASFVHQRESHGAPH